jgi:hypothetical protein
MCFACFGGRLSADRSSVDNYVVCEAIVKH